MHRCREEKKRKIPFFLNCLALAAAVLFSPIAGLAAQGGKPRPNVLLITIDTLRADRLGCYGAQEPPTPNIDSLAARGVIFERAFAHNPETLPSHTNIILGVTPNYHGVHDNSNFRVGPDQLTVGAHLKTYGYATAAVVGAFPLDSRFGLTRGFDLYDDNYGALGSQEFSFVERKAEAVVETALGWLEGRRNPWFLWIHCFDPHQKYDPPEPFKTQYKEHLYNGEIAYVDFALKPLFDYLQEKDLVASTVVVLTADHGESLGEHGESTHGYFAYDATLHVPLIIAGPGVVKGRVTENVCHVDIFPTICDLVGAEKPPFLQGLSLLPAFHGNKVSPSDRDIYFESLYPYYSRGWAPLRGFIEGGAKFIDSPIPEYYDLEKDFGETKNLIGTVKPDVLAARLADLIKRQSVGSKSKPETRPRLDKAAQEKLQSLGYVSSPRPAPKKNFTAQDDLKMLLPYQNKLMKAMGAYHQGQIEEGVTLLKEIIAERKDFDLAYSYLATLYREQRKIKEAVAVLAEGYANNPESYKIITTYGIFLTDVGAFDQAIEVFKKALGEIDYDPDTWNYLGIAYWNKGAYNDAIKAYDRALELDNNYVVVFNNLGSLYLSMAIKNKDAAALRKAIENFSKAISLDPNYASAYNGLGGALEKAGDLDGAIRNWKRAVELKPDYGYALYNLGLANFAKGDKTSALSYFEKYREKFYASLPPKEKAALDQLIQKCKK
jgi:arylsulfatase A-like enzyme/Flp pilus assembly protein TadD